MSYEIGRDRDPTEISDQTVERLRLGAVRLLGTKLMIRFGSKLMDHTADRSDLSLGYIPALVHLREQLHAEDKILQERLQATPALEQMRSHITAADQIVTQRTAEGVYEEPIGWRARRLLACASACIGTVTHPNHTNSLLSFGEACLLAKVNMTLENNEAILDGQDMRTLEQMNQDTQTAGAVATAAYLEATFNWQMGNTDPGPQQS